MDVFDLAETQADLHPRAAAAAPDEVLAHRARDREGRARAGHRGAARAARRREAAAQARLRRARRRRQGARHPPPHRAARELGPERRSHREQPARGQRRPLLGAAQSSTGLLARTGSAEPIPTEGSRSKHDVIVGAVRTTARGEFGLATTARPDDPPLGARPADAAPDQRRTQPVGRRSPRGIRRPAEGRGAGHDPADRRRRPGARARHRERRRQAGHARGAQEPTTGASSASRTATASSAQPWPTVTTSTSSSSRATHSCCASRRAPCDRRVARPAAWPASSSRAGATVAFFGVVDPAREGVVVTSSGSSDALPGTQGGSLKVTPYAEYPPKGRATGGVRCHRFLKGEDTLVLAFAGNTPARAAAANGVAIELPAAEGRRDGSGVPATAVIAHVARQRHGGPTPDRGRGGRRRTPDSERPEGAGRPGRHRGPDGAGSRRAPVDDGHGAPADDACSVQWDHDGTSAYGTAARRRLLRHRRAVGPVGPRRRARVAPRPAARRRARCPHEPRRWPLHARPAPGRPPRPRRPPAGAARARRRRRPTPRRGCSRPRSTDPGELLGLDWGALARGSRALVAASLPGRARRRADPARVHQRPPRRLLRRARPAPRCRRGPGGPRTRVGGLAHGWAPLRPDGRAAALGPDLRTPRRAGRGLGARGEPHRAHCRPSCSARSTTGVARRSRRPAQCAESHVRARAGRDPPRLALRRPSRRRPNVSTDAGSDVVSPMPTGAAGPSHVERVPTARVAPGVLRQEGRSRCSSTGQR